MGGPGQIAPASRRRIMSQCGKKGPTSPPTAIGGIRRTQAQWISPFRYCREIRPRKLPKEPAQKNLLSPGACVSDGGRLESGRSSRRNIWPIGRGIPTENRHEPFSTWFPCDRDGNRCDASQNDWPHERHACISQNGFPWKAGMPFYSDSPQPTGPASWPQ